MLDVSRIDLLLGDDANRIARKAAARKARESETAPEAGLPASPDESPQRDVLGAMPPVPTQERPEELATVERLGATAVATITVTELSGSDAMTLMATLLNHVEGANGSGVRNFVFDLQNVKHMDSSCVGAMVEMLTKLQRAGGAIALVNAGQSVEYLFRLTRLDRLFPICKDVMTAMQAVERASAASRKGRRKK